jgi:hypothetical protein
MNFINLSLVEDGLVVNYLVAWVNHTAKIAYLYQSKHYVLEIRQVDGCFREQNHKRKFCWPQNKSVVVRIWRQRLISKAESKLRLGCRWKIRDVGTGLWICQECCLYQLIREPCAHKRKRNVNCQILHKSYFFPTIVSVLDSTVKKVMHVN